MRVAIIGMGAVGHLMARALASRVDLVRIDRWTAPPSSRTPTVDALLVTTKTPGTTWAAGVAKEILAQDGIALTIQNGLGNAETLGERLGPDRVVRGVIYVGAQLYSDGTLEATGPGRIEIGQPTRANVNLLGLVDVLRAAGVTVELLNDLGVVVWRKLVVNCSVNPTTALLGCTHDELLRHRTGARMVDALALETARIARARGVAVNDEFALQHWRATVMSFSANPHSSMLQDVLMGRETEVDALSGAVARLAARAGVTAPLNSAVAALVQELHPKGVPTEWPFSARPTSRSSPVARSAS